MPEVAIPSQEQARTNFPTLGVWFAVGLTVLGGLLTLIGLRLNEPRPLADEPLIRSDGAQRLTNATGQISYQNACFSPDSQQIAATRWRDGYNHGPADLIIYDLATRTERILVAADDAANVTVPYGCWYDDEIVFASDRGGGQDELWLVKTDGSDLRQITHHTERIPYLEPVFSPAGTQIAFEVNTGSGDDEEQFGMIFVIDRDGRNLTQITGAPDTDDRLPSWAPDGQLLYQHRTARRGEWSGWDVLVTAQARDGTWQTPQNVTEQLAGTTDETDNVWSPNRRSVISSADYGGLTQPNIFAFPLLAGGPLTRLTISDDREDAAPSISPDGRWLVFESHRTADPASPSDLWLKELNTVLREQLAISPDRPVVPTTPPTVQPTGNLPAAPAAPTGWWQPLPGASFQWQLSGELDLTVPADIYDIDYETATDAQVAALHAAGRRAVCYINVGAWEEYRPDADTFPIEVIGKVYAGYPDERWLDIRAIDRLAPLLRARFDLCRAKGFDAIEPDNIDGFEQKSGFPLTAADQARFNRWLAAEAHARGLSIGLKNDGGQIAELLSDFDWAIVEDCVAQDFCADFRPFAEAGKAVIIIDYTDTGTTMNQICAEADRLGYTGILKHRNLDAYRASCP